ncbi:MAG: hypothetical protein AB2717_04935 [Candidatus Thiodiazotropha sp.]
MAMVTAGACSDFSGLLCRSHTLQQQLQGGMPPQSSGCAEALRDQ